MTPLIYLPFRGKKWTHPISKLQTSNDVSLNLIFTAESLNQMFDITLHFLRLQIKINADKYKET